MGCIIQVVGKKDTGKTSAIERAVKILKEKGYSVAVVKHSHHEIDIQGKDTYRFWEAGSDIVIFNDSKCVMFYRCNLNLLYLLPVIENRRYHYQLLHLYFRWHPHLNY